MNINEFAALITRKEAGKKQIDIAQVKEILAIINKKTRGVLYGIIRLLGVSLFFVAPVKSEDLVSLTLLDHVMAVTQFRSGETNIALVDSIVRIGSTNGESVFDLQAGFNSNVKPDSGEVAGANLIVGGFFKVSSLVKDKIKFPDHWKFLNSIEHGPVYFYDLRDKDDFIGYQVGLAFSLQPR